jgi:hypothetical protein
MARIAQKPHRNAEQVGRMRIELANFGMTFKAHLKLRRFLREITCINVIKPKNIFLC